MKVQIGSLSLKHRPKLILAQIIALLGFVLISGLDAKAETIKGKFQYQRNDGSMRPIRSANVEIWRFAPRAFGIPAWGHDGDAVTGTDGSFTKNMPFVESGVIYAVRVFASNYAAVVWEENSPSLVSFFREPLGPDGNPLHHTVTSPSDVKIFDFNFTDQASRVHYNLAEVVRHGFDYATSHRDPAEGDILTRVNVQPQSIPFSYYNPVNDTMCIMSPQQVFQDIGTLHEYGHFLEDTLSYFFPMPARHDGCTAEIGGVIVNSPEHAWMEGFADYFAQAVARSLPDGTVTGSLGTPEVFTLENRTPCTVASPDAIELNVAGTLWDLLDGIGGSNGLPEPWDFIAGKDLEIFRIFDKELDHLGHAPTIWDFLNAWNARGLDQPALLRVSSHNNITPLLPRQTSECLSMTAPSLMFPGQTYNVTVVMRNTGESTWGTNHFLGSQSPQDNNNFQRPRVALPGPVPPGGQVTLSFSVTAPSIPGMYTLQFRMVEEFVEWFGDFTPAFNIEVRGLRIEVVPVSNTSTTETVRVYAYSYATGAPVQGTVTSSVTSPAPTGTNITFSRPWVLDCNDVVGGRPKCHREYLQVVFTVTAEGYGSAQYWY